MCGDDFRMAESRDNRKTSRNHARCVHGSFSNADSRTRCQFSCSEESGIAKTSNNIPIHSLEFSRSHFFENTGDAHRFVVMAFNRNGAALRVARNNFRTGRSDGSSSRSDLLGHAGGSVGVDNFDFHG